MIELAKHIEILLLENDCVIVPDLGGFIAHYQSARYDEEDQVYYPPQRTIGFNPKLIINDGLLAQFYMRAYHTDFSDATRRISKEVEIIKNLLHSNGYIEIVGIGTLSCNIHNTYEFQPQKEGCITPYLYELNPLYINELSRSNQNSEKLIPLTPKENEEKKKNNIIPLRRISAAVSVVAALILFFFLSVPVENTYMDDGNYASLGTNELISRIQSQSLALNIVPPNVPMDKKQPVGSHHQAKKMEEKAETAPMENQLTNSHEVKPTDIKKSEDERNILLPEKSPTSIKANKKYHIIIASLETQKDAETTIERFKENGLTGLSVKEGSGHFRIVIQSFDDMNAAYNKLNELKQQEAFKNAWLLSSK